MGLVLHDAPASSNALKVRFCLAELGLPYERRPVPLARPRPADYLALNPVGLIPTLEDEGFVLSESQAILRYLAAREARDDLYPADVRDRARVDEFLDRFATGIRGAFFRHEQPALGYTPGAGWTGAPDPVAAARVAAEIAPTIDLLERLVSAEGAVLGRFTIGDCALAPVLFRTTLTGLDLSGHPRLTALRSALLSRPAWAAAEPVT